MNRQAKLQDNQEKKGSEQSGETELAQAEIISFFLMFGFWSWLRKHEIQAFTRKAFYHRST